MNETFHVPGFRFGGVAAQIKKNGKLDLGAIVADEPATVAALFTKNIVKAAPVIVATDRAKRGKAQAVLVNAGCANACTGAPGLAAARETTHLFAQALGVRDEEVLPASTGVIGAQLPVEKFRTAMPAVVSALSPTSAVDFADAIC